MEQELIRTCTAEEAAVLASTAGRWARVGALRVRVQEPAPDAPIDPTGSARYRVRVTIAGPDSDPRPPAADETARVLSRLFGPYLA